MIRCAVEVIAELGLPRASLAEIAKRAGVSKGAVLYHFADRDELITEVLTSVLAQGASYIAEHRPDGGTPAEELRAYIEANVRYIAGHRDDVRVLTSIAMNFTTADGESKLQPDASVYGVALAPLQDILARGQATGEFTDFDTRTVAMTIRAAIDAIGPQLWAIPDLDLELYGRELAALVDRATRVT